MRVSRLHRSEATESSDFINVYYNCCALRIEALVCVAAAKRNFTQRHCMYSTCHLARLGRQMHFMGTVRKLTIRRAVHGRPPVIAIDNVGDAYMHACEVREGTTRVHSTEAKRSALNGAGPVLCATGGGAVSRRIREESAAKRVMQLRSVSPRHGSGRRKPDAGSCRTGTAVLDPAGVAMHTPAPQTPSPCSRL